MQLKCIEKYGDAGMARFSRLCSFIFVISIFLCLLFVGLPLKTTDSSVTNSPSTSEYYFPFDPNESAIKGKHTCFYLSFKIPHTADKLQNVKYKFLQNYSG